MAELKPELLSFSAAATGITLTIGKRLSRNFSYYRKSSGKREWVYRNDILIRIDEVSELSFGLHNLMMNLNETNSPFLVAVAGQIVDTLDDIHHKLLIFNAKKIVDIISSLDSLRKKWRYFAEPEFYDQRLNSHIEYEFPLIIKKIETGVQSLPYKAHL